MESQCFGRRRINLSEEGRRNENLDVRFEYVREQLVGEPLRALAGLDLRRRLTQCDQDLELADRLQHKG